MTTTTRPKRPPRLVRQVAHVRQQIDRDVIRLLGGAVDPSVEQCLAQLVARLVSVLQQRQQQQKVDP